MLVVVVTKYYKKKEKMENRWLLAKVPIRVSSRSSVNMEELKKFQPFQTGQPEFDNYFHVNS